MFDEMRAGDEGDRAPGGRAGSSPRGAVRTRSGSSRVLAEPPAELVAFWGLVDAQYGEPEPAVVVGERAVEGLDDFALVELIAELERDASFARARQLAAVEVLSRRKSMNPFWPVRVAEPCVAGEEVAARLGSSRAAGRELVAVARLFAGSLLATAAALQAGEIDWGKARIVAAVLGDVAVQVAVDVQARVLPGAGARTHAQLRRDLARALVVVDPVDAEQRVVRAVDKRRVCRPRVLADGMAGVWAVLPGAVAAGIDAALADAARAGRSAGDPRTSDQLRADAFAGALLGGGAQVLGSGGAGATGLGCGAGAAFGSPAGARGCGSCGCGGSGGSAAVRVDVTVGFATLMGVDEAPGELAGFGPITAQTARRLAAAGTWRRLVTDPVSGTVMDVGRTRYRPPRDLAEIVRARDRRCVSPVCGVAAGRCDLDHRVPFAADGTGGATSVENLGALCRRDHLLKTHARWQLQRDPARSGSLVWRTPTGHEYPSQDEPLPGHEPPLAWDDPPPF